MISLVRYVGLPQKLVLITLNSTIYLRTVINTIFNYDVTKENKTRGWWREKIIILEQLGEWNTRMAHFLCERLEIHK